MKDSLRDREFDRFRPAGDDLSKVAVTVEQDAEGLIFEQADANTIYLAEGLFGALTSEAKWKIKKIDLTSGVRILSASNAFDQIWNDRAALTYV